MSLDHSLFDTLLEPVFILSSEGKVVYCNEPAALVCGVSARKISRGLYFKDLLTFSEPLDWIQQLSAVTSPAPYKEVNFTTPDGSAGKVQVTVQPLPQDEASNPLWIVFVRDVTLEERLQKKYRAELEQKEDVILDLQKAQAELEQYSKNLEKMVQERTQQISRMNRLMKALLDSLSQGFFIFDQNGMCLEVSSKACEVTVESAPAGQLIWDVLKLPPTKVEGFKRWMTTVFSEMLPFADLAPLGPTNYSHSEGLNIALEYFPLRSEENQIDGIVVVASDITNLVEAQRQARIEKQHAEMIIHLVQNKHQVGRFIRESESLLQELTQELAVETFNGEGVFRCLHTLKGGAGMLSVLSMTEACHAAETQLSEYLQTPSSPAATQVRNLCASIPNEFQRFKEEAKQVLGPSILSEQRLLELSSQELERLLAKFRVFPQAGPVVDEVLAILTQEPAESFFQPYKDTVEKLASRQNKLIREVKFINGQVPVVPEIYSGLFASFVHAFRNAVDHGLEMPEERVACDKPEGGQIVAEFETLTEPPRLRITVRDDGRGINPEKIRAKLKSKGIETNESDEAVLQHVFDSQFSTAEAVSDISGRGVGLDALKHEAEALGGHAWVASRMGTGSSVIVEVPLMTQLPERRQRPIAA